MHDINISQIERNQKSRQPSIPRIGHRPNDRQKDTTKIYKYIDIYIIY